MYAKQPKKLLILNILDILWKDSDQDHRLTQREIGEILRTRYGMAADRKAIKRNLMDLVEFGFDIEYREVPRGGAGEEEENTILTDFYLVRPFTEGELRLLIDGLLFSRHLPHRQCRELVEKLEGLSSRYFRSRVRHITRMPGEQEDNQQLFLTLSCWMRPLKRGKKQLSTTWSTGQIKRPAAVPALTAASGRMWSVPIRWPPGTAITTWSAAGRDMGALPTTGWIGSAT